MQMKERIELATPRARKRARKNKIERPYRRRELFPVCPPRT